MSKFRSSAIIAWTSDITVSGTRPVEPNQHQLVEIGRLLDSGDLRPVVDGVAPFSRAAEAYAGTFEKRGRGKLVVAVAETLRLD